MRCVSLCNASRDERLGILFGAVPGQVALVTVEGDTPRCPDGEAIAALLFHVPGVAVAVADLSFLHACIIPAFARSVEHYPRSEGINFRS